MKRWIPLLIVFLTATAGCGAEAESASEGRGTPFGQPLNPWDTIPPDSLYGATAAENVEVTPVELHVLGIPPGWDGMRIAAISDLQLDAWSGNLEVAAAAIEQAVSERPDVVFLLGDYLGDGTDLTPLSGLLAPLRGIPTFAVLGDRDTRSDSLAARIAGALGEAGIRVLRNEVAAFERGGDTAVIAGVDADLAGEPIADQEWVLSQLGLGRPVALLLAHSPLLAARADDDRVPAAIAGGTFCGPMEVPDSPRLSWINSEALPGLLVQGTERLYRTGQMVMFVTCGVGYGFVPVRFGAAPEVALITLRRVGVEQEPADSVAPDTLFQQYEESLRDTTG